MKTLMTAFIAMAVGTAALAGAANGNGKQSYPYEYEYCYPYYGEDYGYWGEGVNTVNETPSGNVQLTTEGTSGWGYFPQGTCINNVLTPGVPANYGGGDDISYRTHLKKGQTQIYRYFYEYDSCYQGQINGGYELETKISNGNVQVNTYLPVETGVPCEVVSP